MLYRLIREDQDTHTATVVRPTIHIFGMNDFIYDVRMLDARERADLFTALHAHAYQRELPDMDPATKTLFERMKTRVHRTMQ